MIDELLKIQWDNSSAEKTQFDKGYAQGYAEGLAESRATGWTEIIRNMKRKGFDTATISDITGLTEKEIESF